MPKGASLNPADMLSGGRVPDGRYTIKGVTAEVFDYGGKAKEVPAACIVFKSSDGQEHEQYYSAGDLEYLTPAEDKSMFVHPRGEDAKLSLNSNFGKFMQAIIGAGFPVASITDKLNCLAGSDIELVGQAQPKNQSGKESVLVLPTKYYGKVGAKGNAPSRVPTATAAPKPGTSPAPAASGPAANGELTNAEAIVQIQAVFQTVTKDKETELPTTTPAKLGTAVMLACSRTKNPHAQALRKLAADEKWMKDNGDAGGWLFDPDTGNVVLVA